MDRPRLDLGKTDLPIDLAPTLRYLDGKLIEGWLEALGDRCEASRALYDEGVVPPQGLTGSTIFLAFSHFDLSGGVYSREQVTYHRPVAVGDTLEVTGTIAFTYVRRARRYRIMASQTTDGAGRLAVSSRSSGVVRFREDTDEGEESTASPGEDIPAPLPDPALAECNPSRRRLARLSPGDLIRGGPQRVTLEMMRVWEGRESRNPIHTDAEIARREGLSAPIAGGPHVLAYLQESMMAELGPRVFLYGSHFDVRWIAPVAAGGEVESEAVFRGVEDGLAGFELGMTCDGEPCLVGKAVVPIAAV